MESDRPESVPSPKSTLTVLDGMAVLVGMVIGAGIFRTPSIVAGQCTGSAEVLLLWTAGGFVSLIGALCYAELASAYPHPGGDYHFLSRSFGRVPSFLFAWSRMTVIQTGSIAMLAFLIGDYAARVAPIGPFSASVYGALTIVVLTGINMTGIRQGRSAQNFLTALIVLGLLALVVLGLKSPMGSQAAVPTAGSGSTGALGRAMIFVLLTYGGWNEVAYLSAEVRKARKNMVRVLLYGIGVVTLLYVAVNYVFLRTLGLTGAASSEAVALDTVNRIWGGAAGFYVGLLVVFAVLSTMNAVIITGSRTNYAFGRDHGLFGFLGRWNPKANTPVNALVFQAIIALALVALGTGSKSGFTMMVEYTAPVFWLFFFLVGVSLFVLRRREGAVVRPFRVPLYPVTPLIFCSVCLYMLYSSLMYTGTGALVGIVVLLAGVPLFILKRPKPEMGQVR